MEYLAYSNMVIANEGENIDIECSLPKVQFPGKKHFKSAELAFTLLGVLLAILAPNQATATYRGPGRYSVSTNGGCLNIRTGPSTSYPSVACYSNGSRLPQIIGYSQGFAHTDTDYYASSNWITSRNRNNYSYDTDTDYYTPGNRRTSYRNNYSYDTNNDSYVYSNNRSYSSSRNDNSYYPYGSNYSTSGSNSGISIGGNTNTAYPSVRFPRLTQGSRGEAVRQVQTALGLPATGYYDYRTYNAVRNFQASNGIRADGVVGSQTAVALGVYY